MSTTFDEKIVLDNYDDWNRMTDSQGVDPAIWKQWQQQLLNKSFEEQEKRKIENHGEAHELTELEFRRFLNNLIVTIEDIPSIYHTDLINQHLDNAFRMGPVQPLWDRPLVSDIQVFVPLDDQYDQIISYTEAGVRKTYKEQQFRSFDHAKDWVNHHLGRISLRFDPAKVYLDGMFPHGERINIISGPCGYSTFNPISKEYQFVRCMIISIRRFVNSFTLEELTDQSVGQHMDISFAHENVSNKDSGSLEDYDIRPVHTRFTGGTADRATIDFLKIMVQLGKNHLISGGTGTGKTTLANSLTSMVPQGTVLLVLEEAPEMQPQLFGHVMRVYERPGVFNLRDGLINGLRMFPDRIFVTELRDSQVGYAFVQAIQSGHDGSSTTIHASGCQSAFDRAVELAAGHESRPNRSVIESILRERISVIIHCNRQGADRMIDHVVEVDPLSGEFHTVSKFKQIGRNELTGRPIGYFKFYGPSSRFIQQMIENGIEIPHSWKWRKKT